MGRRAPDNPRYQRGATLGKTRRSAASAKPKHGGSSSGSSASGGKKSKPSLFAPVPTTPAYRRLRKIWAANLAAAIVLSAFAWWQQGTWPGTVAIVVAYACIFTAFYLDFMKLRPMRKEAIEAEKAEKDAKSGGKKA